MDAKRVNCIVFDLRLATEQGVKHSILGWLLLGQLKGRNLLVVHGPTSFGKKIGKFVAETCHGEILESKLCLESPPASLASFMESLFNAHQIKADIDTIYLFFHSTRPKKAGFFIFSNINYELCADCRRRICSDAG